jgi:hypothetical protein
LADGTVYLLYHGFFFFFFKKNKQNSSHEPSLSPAGCFTPKGHLEETGPRNLIKQPVPSVSIGTVNTYARLVHSHKQTASLERLNPLGLEPSSSFFLAI